MRRLLLTLVVTFAPALAVAQPPVWPSGSPVSLPSQSYVMPGPFINGAGVANGPINLPDGTPSAPSIAFIANPNRGLLNNNGIAVVNAGAIVWSWDSSGNLADAGTHTLTVNGSIIGGTGAVIGSNGTIGWSNSTKLDNAGDGYLLAKNSGATSTVRLKFSGAPTAGTCGTSPSVSSASNDTQGEINVGTGTPASCVVNFNSAWNAAPRCQAVVSTATAGNVRAIGVTTTTSTMTLTPASAFAASSLVWWFCVNGT